MKHIYQKNENDGYVTNNIVEELCQIDLTHDAVICLPHWKDKRKKEVEDTNDFLTIRNYQELRLPTQQNPLYEFEPRMKISLPNGLYLSFEPIVSGLQILQTTYTILEGVKLDKIIVNGDSDKEILISGVKGKYNIYQNFCTYLKEFSRKAFNKNTFTGSRIPEDKDILRMKLNYQFIGRDYYTAPNDIYLIYSTYLFKRFPNF